jgi:5-methylcytosine-specific restriction endonuclease McrA
MVKIYTGAKYAILGNIKWLEEQLKTKSFRDLAKEVGTTEGNISDRVKRYGLRPKNSTHSSFVKVGLKKKYPDGRYKDKSPNWKGGISTLYNLVRESIRNKKWQKLCLNRDNFTCQKCKKIGGDLEVHHIKQLALIIKENNIKTIEDAFLCYELWDINNGVTLCLTCHKETDSHSNKNF